MSHYAKVNNGIVEQVIVADADFFTNGHFVDTSPGEWIQTSYNTHGGIHYGQDWQPDGGIALRGNYAGIGMIYDSVNDVFYTKQPFPSWTLNNTTWIWEAPSAYPNNGKTYVWNESTLNWTETS
jgi:hypothetical protein